MSIRYGVSLLTDPDFTARAYRARQLICGQFACWAAEMHMLHMFMSDYFPLADADDANAENQLAGDLEQLAERYRRVSPRFPMFNRGITTTRNTDDDGNIWLDFSPEVVNESLYRLQSMVADLLERNPAVHGPRCVFGPDFPPQMPLLSHANLPDTVFDSALEFARSVTDELKVSQITRAWRLTLTRFESNAAGDDWSGGRWAADLQWRVIGSYSL
jgi:hypothetical protein